MPEFKREDRYIVLKRSDMDCFDSFWWDILHTILAQVMANRQSKGKKPLECVVVENDWPEYEPTWKAIKDRMEA